jgi:hypothetical protein
LNPRTLRTLQRKWYEKAGYSMEDLDPLGRPCRVSEGRTSRAQDTQDPVFSGEMAEAAREILTHPGLTSRERRTWKLFTNHATYEQIAAEIRCSYRDVSAIIDRVQALMLHPTTEKETDMKKPKKSKTNSRGAGRPPTMHVKGADGLTACGKAAASDRLTTAGKTNCKACMMSLGVASHPVTAPKQARHVDRVTLPNTMNIPGITKGQMLDFEPLTIPGDEAAAWSAPNDFIDLESTIEIGVKNAHRKIVEISGNPVLSSADVSDNERAVHTLLSVRRGELDYLKRGLTGAAPSPAKEAEVVKQIDKETSTKTHRDGPMTIAEAAGQVSQLEGSDVSRGNDTDSPPQVAPAFPAFPGMPNT